MKEKIRKEVKLFAKAMEFKLKKNDHKGGWKQSEDCTGCDFIFLENKLNEEMQEFMTAFYNRSNRMLNEAADVANILMMICDVAGRLK